MKRRLVFMLCAALLLVLSAAVFWFYFHEPAATIVYYNEYTGVSFREELTQEEAARVAEIFHSSSAEDIAPSSVPSCGFHRRVYIYVDGTKYHPALDGCSLIFTQNSPQYRYISPEQRAYIDQLFAAYGGTFPCI